MGDWVAVAALMRKSKGFTLLELIVVIIILGIISAFAVVQFNRTAEKARGDGAIADLRMLYSGQKMYYSDHGEYTLDFVEISKYVEHPNLRPNNPFNYILQNPLQSFDFLASAERKSGPYKGAVIVIRVDGSLCGFGGWPWVDPWQP